MNGVAYKFTAAPVSGAAGMYTADFEGVRASWVVREDGTAIGVQFNAAPVSNSSSPTCSNSTTTQFRAEVRNKRKLQQAQQITQAAERQP